MSYYNQSKRIERAALPDKIRTAHGVTFNPTPAELQAAGWITAPVVPFVPPEGFAIIPGTRRVSVINGEALEVYNVETLSEAEARKQAEELADLESRRTAEENRDLFKIVFRMCNLHRPENMKITPAEARGIVSQIIT